MSKPEQTDALATLTETGKAPKTRLNSAESGWNIVSTLIRKDEERAKKRATIQGQIDGNPPYDQAELVRLGQANRSNVNTRSAEALRDSRKTSYYELLMEVDTFVDVSIPSYDEKELDPSMDYGQIIAEKFTDMLTSWPGFWYNMMLHQEQFVTWGAGNVYWKDEIDWRFRAARIGAFLVPDSTLATIEDFECIAVRGDFRIHKLFERVKDRETEAKSKALGWNTGLIKKAIQQAVERFNPDNKYGTGDWETLQSTIKENDLEFGTTVFPTIQYSSLLYAEFDGKISHMMILENGDVCKETSPSGKKENWLFRKIGQFESWEQFTCPFLANIGEGSYHSIRGMGQKIFAMSVIIDRLFNTTLDGTMANSTILLQPSNDPQKERVRMVRVGPFSIMPAGYSVIPQGSFRPDLQGTIGVMNLVGSTLNQNVGMFRPDVTDTENTPQATSSLALQQRATKEAKLEKSDINIYYTQWDNLFKEVLRRVLSSKLTDIDPGGKEAKAFIKACTDAGVPASLLKSDKLKISARRAIGVGSPVMRSIVSADILSVSPYFDEKGKDNAVRDYIAARAGQRAVRRYKPESNRNNIPSNDHSIAVLENNDLKEGSVTEVGVDQPHVIHLMVHMKPIVELFDAYMNGKVDPMMLYRYAAVALPHMATHLDLIAKDPARGNEYRQFMDIFNDLAKQFRQLEAEVSRMQQQQQKQQAEDAQVVADARSMEKQAELQIKLQKVQGDLMLKEVKQEAQLALKEMQARHKMQIDEILAQHKMQIESIVKGAAQ